MKVPSSVLRTIEFEFGTFKGELLEYRIKQCCQGDSTELCDEYPTCYYMMHGLAASSVEAGLRWLHDRTNREHFGTFLGHFFGGVADVVLEDYAPMAIELGLRWLHDRVKRCSVCQLTPQQSHMKRFGDMKTFRAANYTPELCYACLEEQAMKHGCILE